MNFSGSFKKLDNLLQLFFGLLHTGYILKRHRRLVAGEHAGSTLAKRKRLVVAALSLAQHKPNDTDYKQRR